MPNFISFLFPAAVLFPQWLSAQFKGMFDVNKSPFSLLNILCIQLCCPCSSESTGNFRWASGRKISFQTKLRKAKFLLRGIFPQDLQYYLCSALQTWTSSSVGEVLHNCFSIENSSFHSLHDLFTVKQVEFTVSTNMQRKMYEKRCLGWTTANTSCMVKPCHQLFTAVHLRARNVGKFWVQRKNIHWNFI